MKLLVWYLLLRASIAHPEIVLKQAILETHSFRSDLCVHRYNLFGLKKGRHYAHFPSYKECVDYYALHVSSRYHGGDYYKFLQRIRYAKDKKYVHKLRKINTQDMKQALIMDSTTMGPVACLLDTGQIAPLRPNVVKLCCGEPAAGGCTVTPEGKLMDDLHCCGKFQYLELKAGHKVIGTLYSGIFAPVDFVNEPESESPDVEFQQGDDNMFEQ